jgi:hypothetical protein
LSNDPKFSDIDHLAELFRLFRSIKSPIERRLLEEIVFDVITWNVQALRIDSWQACGVEGEPITVEIDHQFDAAPLPYRMDFRVRMTCGDLAATVFVECDGHEWHSTREQKARDARRDREVLQAHDVPTVRFTGSEIHKDPLKCAHDIVEMLHRRVRPWLSQGSLPIVKGDPDLDLL